MRRVLWLLPLLAAAGLLLSFLVPGDPAPAPDPNPVGDAAVLYERAISDVESAFADRGEAHRAISPELAAIDEAIAEGRLAAEAAPEDEQAQQSLLESLSRKLELLHNTLMLMRDLERGDGEAARDRIEDFSGPEPPSTG